jgi:hypothetical protein
MKSRLPSPESVFPLLFLFLTGLALYAPALGARFLSFDDPEFVVNNPLIRSVSLENLRAILSRPYFFTYQPVTLLSYLADASLFGIQAGAFHAVNLLLFFASAAMIYAIVRMENGGTPASFVAAFLFLIHPVNVEAAVWVSSRKDLLSLFFVLASWILFVRHVRFPGRMHLYSASALAFLLATFSKQSVVAFPLMMLLYRPLLRREEFSWRHLKELIPFGLISLAGVCAVYWAHHSHSYRYSYFPHGGGIVSNAWIACVAFKEYLLNLASPTGLSAVYYLEDRGTPFSFEAWVSLLCVILFISAIAFCLKRRRRPAAFLLLWYSVNLLPVINIVPTSTAMADRYIFIPAIGLFVGLGIVVSRLLLHPTRWVPRLAGLALVLWLGFLAYTTSQRIPVWQNTLDFWRDAVRKAPSSYVANAGMASGYDATGEFEEARRYYFRALEIQPGNADILNDIGATYATQKRWPEAGDFFRRALRINPGHGAARRNLDRIGTR